MEPHELTVCECNSSMPCADTTKFRRMYRTTKFSTGKTKRGYLYCTIEKFATETTGTCISGFCQISVLTKVLCNKRHSNAEIVLKFIGTSLLHEKMRFEHTRVRKFHALNKFSTINR